MLDIRSQVYELNPSQTFSKLRHLTEKNVYLSFSDAAEFLLLSRITFFMKSSFPSPNKTFQFVRWRTWEAVFTSEQDEDFFFSSCGSGLHQGPPGPSQPLCSSLQQMRGSAGCEMAAVIAPRPRGLQPIHSPVSALIEAPPPPPPPAVTLLKGTVNHKEPVKSQHWSSSLFPTVSKLNLNSKFLSFYVFFERQ